MECKKCVYFPCIRKECNLKDGKCEFGKSLIYKILKEIKKEELGCK